jgi:pre-rRNA-processing protein IPI3
LLSTKDNMTSHQNVQTPYCTLSDHTLAISDIVVGVGKFPKCRVLSSSTDGTCKVSQI